LDDEKLHHTRERLEPMLRFEPLAGVSRAIFIAAPHRGTDVANGRIARGVAKFVRMPQAVIKEFEEYRRTLGDAEHGKPDPGTDPYSQQHRQLECGRSVLTAGGDAADLVHRALPLDHCPNGFFPLLEQSDDGLVPYWSAHLDGAASEKVIVAGHRVQESAAAILEVRRILQQHIAEASIADHVVPAPRTARIVRGET
jgi:hypothetical protein